MKKSIYTKEFHTALYKIDAKSLHLHPYTHDTCRQAYRQTNDIPKTAFPYSEVLKHVNLSKSKDSNLYFPISNLTVFQKGPQYFGIKVYNSLPSNIEQLSSNKKPFKKALLQFLHLHLFYDIEESFNYKDDFVVRVSYVDCNE
jgi:hypothetical protein